MNLRGRFSSSPDEIIPLLSRMHLTPNEILTSFRKIQVNKRG